MTQPAPPLLNPASPWCLRWHHGRHSWRHRSEGGFDRRRYRVEPIPEVQARMFVLAHHYADTYVNARLRYGLFDLADDRLVGAAVLSVPAQQKVLTKPFPTLTPYYESIDLGRFVLLDQVPANAETFFLAEAFRLAADDGIRAVVSFADPTPRTSLDGRVIFPGHRGAIYQAASAMYLGRSTPGREWLLPDGQVISDRTLSKVRGREQGADYAEALLIAHGATPPLPGQDPRAWLAQARVQARVRVVPTHGKLRYGFLLGSKAQRRRVRLGLPRLPYPKDHDLPERQASLFDTPVGVAA